MESLVDVPGLEEGWRGGHGGEAGRRAQAEVWARAKAVGRGAVEAASLNRHQRLQVCIVVVGREPTATIHMVAVVGRLAGLGQDLPDVVALGW